MPSIANKWDRKESGKKDGGVKDEKQLVIQGSHMVSGTRRPAGSDPVKRWSESRAVALKSQCPVEHRGEFRDVRPSVHPEAYFRLQMTDLGL